MIEKEKNKKSEQLNNIPEELQCLRRWMCATKEGQPICVKDGKGNGWTNNKNWVSFFEAKTCVDSGKYPYASFVVGEIEDGKRIVVIDLDGESHGIKLNETAKKDLLGKTYTEKSRSGDGLHFIGYYSGNAFSGENFKDKDGKGVGVEIYNNSKAIIMTGDVYNNNPIPLKDITEIVDYMRTHREKYGAAPIGTTEEKRSVGRPKKISFNDAATPPQKWIDEELEEALKVIPSDSYDLWYKIGLALKSFDADFKYFDEYSKKSDKYDGEEKTKKKYDSLIPNGDITWKTIVFHARLNGFESKYIEKKPLFDNEYFLNEIEKDGIKIRFNDITKEVEHESERFKNISLVTMISDLYLEYRKYFNGISEKILGGRFISLAERNKYNPVLDLITEDKWDGVDRLPQVWKILSIQNDDFSKLLFTKWMWQALVLLHNTDDNYCGADGILTLKGPQGIGKTRFAEKLAIKQQWFQGSAKISKDKDDQRRICQSWISELGELDSVLEKESAGRIKAFLNLDFDQYRLPYSAEDIKSPRRVSMIATVNADKFLIDTTGNRRFFTVQVNSIDLDELKKLDALQLWRQIYEAYVKDKSDDDRQKFRLTPEEREMLAKRNRSFEAPLPSETDILDIMEIYPNRTQQTVSEFKKNFDQYLRPYSVQQIGVALSKLGFEIKMSSVNGEKGRRGMLPDPFRPNYTR